MIDHEPLLTRALGPSPESRRCHTCALPMTTEEWDQACVLVDEPDADERNHPECCPECVAARAEANRDLADRDPS